MIPYVKECQGAPGARSQSVAVFSSEPRLAGLAAHSAGGCAACYAAMGFDT